MTMSQFERNNIYQKFPNREMTDQSPILSWIPMFLSKFLGASFTWYPGRESSMSHLQEEKEMFVHQTHFGIPHKDKSMKAHSPALKTS